VTHSDPNPDPWAVVVSDPDGFPDDVFGPFDRQDQALDVAQEALRVINDRKSRFAGTEEVYPFKMKPWAGGEAWERGEV
jgi:hypothetical protein